MMATTQTVAWVARGVLAVTSITYLAAGVYCLARPDALRTGLGLTPAHAPARVELMAVYGGLEIGLGLFFGLCAVVRGWQTCGLAASALTFGALVAVRLVGASVHHAFGGQTLAFLAMECVLGAAAGVAWLWRVLGRGA